MNIKITNNYYVLIMNKTEIINYWSYKSHPKHRSEEQLIKSLVVFYERTFGTKLTNLNLIDEIFETNNWYICENTSTIYQIVTNLNDTTHNNTVIEILSELKRYTFKKVTFELFVKKETDAKPDQYILQIQLNDKQYFLLNYSVEDKSVVNLNKPSRLIRYKRRLIVVEQYNQADTENENQPKQKRKRALSELGDCEIKPVKKQIKNDKWDTMVSASSIRNYMLDDPLIDYLKEYNINDINDQPSRTSKTFNSSNFKTDLFTQQIMSAGIDFESELVNLIKKDHIVVKVADFIHARSEEKFNETIKLMKNGVPIIYQGVLHDYENSTYGLPDLIVRADYINKLMGYNLIDPEEESIGSPKLGVKWHYKIIDIKHSNIQLTADNTHIQNSESIPAYKGQLYIYTRCLNNILGVSVNKAYIWGKKYSSESCKVVTHTTNFLNKLATIDYDNFDKHYIEKVNMAVNWIKTLRSEGKNWSLVPIPSRSELFPNMKNEKDSSYKHVKKQLSESINEITQVWQCGFKRRQQAHQNKVFSWSDPNCTSQKMGFGTTKIGKTVDAICSINRQEEIKIAPTKVLYDRPNWIKAPNDTVEFYLDFETLNSNFGSIIKDGCIGYNSNQYIFMIGVGYSNNGNWTFKNFVMEHKDNNSEYKMYTDFLSWINNVLKEQKKTKAKMYHWSYAEVGMLKNFKSRQINQQFNDSHISFYDLNAVFINEPITIVGALDFSLKTIAKAMYNNGFIKSNWDTSSVCSNGLNAMILANKLYETVKSDINQEPIMKEICYYNEIDCKVMWEIHNYIKTNA